MAPPPAWQQTFDFFPPVPIVVEPTEAQLSGRVLVVEYEDDGREALCDLVRLCGHEARAAGDGLAALHMALRWRPHAALITLDLPLLDGFQVALRLRHDLGGGVLLAAVTGHDRGEDRRRCLGAGFDHFLVKPVDSHAVRSLLLGV
jgi:CheY-like chemotaxis protein